jgi:hypothetical protein
VAYHVCAALANIAAHAAGKSAVITTGGLSVIEAAIVRHDESKSRARLCSLYVALKICQRVLLPTWIKFYTVS